MADRSLKKASGFRVPTQTGLSVKDLKERVNKANNGGGADSRELFLRDGDEATVRILDDPENWVTYQEHWHQQLQAVPCIGDGCPLCDDSNPTDRAYIRVFAYEVSRPANKGYKARLDEPKKVMLMKINSRQQADLLTRAERRKTITDRDVTITRTGSGASDTTYSYDWADERSPIPREARRITLDAAEFLSERAEKALKALGAGKVTKKKTTNRVSSRGASRKERIEDIEEDFDDDDLPF